MSTERPTGDLRLLLRLLRQARPYWPHLAGIFVLDALAAPLALLVPVPLMLAVDSVLGDKPLPALLQAVAPAAVATSTGERLVVIALLVVVFAIAVQAQKLGNWLLQTYTGQRLCVDFRASLLRHAQRMSLLYHDARGSADAIYRIQYDAAAIEWIIVYGLSPLLAAVLTLCGMIVVTARLDWQIAAVALAASPALFLLTQHFRRRLRTVWSGVKEIESSALGIVQEVLAALRVVKAFGQEDVEQRRFTDRAGQGVAAHMRVVLTESAFSATVGLTIAVGTALVLFLGVTHVQTGLLTTGQLLLVMAYLAQLYQPLETLGRQIATLQGGLASADRAFNLLDHVAEVAEAPAPRRLARARGEIEMQDVGFSYDGRTPVLSKISVSVPAGATVGIVGQTGAGKTTLLNLLLRFYDPSEGRILLDGVDLREYRLEDLRSQFSVVLQEPILFSRSIAENIAYGRTGATRQEIEQSAAAAHADQFIRELPQGYETPVGERGMRLSGGERQRIALARAFLKDAPILILDEPTSSVDVRTESAIMEAMQRLMRGRTTFLIAHRLSTLDACDRQFFVDGGQLREIGAGLSPDRRRELVETLFRADGAREHANASPA